MQILNESQHKILLALKTYKFLTTSQMVALGIKTDRRNLVKPLGALLKGRQALIKRLDLGVMPKKGRLEQLYYLSSGGVDFLVKHLAVDSSSIHYPKGEVVFYHDYFHRKAVVNCHIALRQGAEKQGYTVELFDSYFDKTGANPTVAKTSTPLTAKTKIILENDEHIIADAIGLFEAGEEKHLFALEVHCGQDSGRIVKQLQKYLYVLATGELSVQHGLQKNAFILNIFEHSTCQEAVVKRLKKLSDFAGFEQWLLFQALAEAQQDFFSGWRTLSDRTIHLY